MNIQLTEQAADHILASLAKRGHGLGLRVGIKTMGCTGYAYALDYADALEDGDTVFEAHGAKVIVAEKDMPILSGTTIDFINKGLNRNFEFHNPNAEDHCGCGESFNIKTTGDNHGQ